MGQHREHAPPHTQPYGCARAPLQRERSVKFIFADALDMIDPTYDFATERSSTERTRYWGDQYPHEYLDTPPYDGVLVSRGIVGDHKISGKYSESQAMRFRRVGAREFLRLTGPKF